MRDVFEMITQVQTRSLKIEEIKELCADKVLAVYEVTAEQNNSTLKFRYTYIVLLMIRNEHDAAIIHFTQFCLQCLLWL